MVAVAGVGQWNWFQASSPPVSSRFDWDCTWTRDRMQSLVQSIRVSPFPGSAIAGEEPGSPRGSRGSSTFDTRSALPTTHLAALPSTQLTATPVSTLSPVLSARPAERDQADACTFPDHNATFLSSPDVPTPHPTLSATAVVPATG